MCLTLAYVVSGIPGVTYTTPIDSAKVKKREKKSRTNF